MAKLDQVIAVMASSQMRHAGADDAIRQRAAPRNPEPSVVEEGPAAALGFDAVSGNTYTVLFCDDLDLGAWQKLRDISGSSGAVTVNDPSPLENGRFYRLVTPALP